MSEKSFREIAIEEFRAAEKVNNAENAAANADRRKRWANRVLEIFERKFSWVPDSVDPMFETVKIGGLTLYCVDDGPHVMFKAFFCEKCGLYQWVENKADVGHALVMKDEHADCPLANLEYDEDGNPIKTPEQIENERKRALNEYANGAAFGWLSRRDLFAAMAMQGLLAGDTKWESTPDVVADAAVELADVLIAELHQESQS